jgi:hypothetical protein
VTITRGLWLRGTGEGTLLDDANGRMCCLSFVCLRYGVPKAELHGHELPTQLYDQLDKFPAWLKDDDQLDNIVMTNDGEMRSSRREKKLIKLFAEKGLTVKFRD